MPILKGKWYFNAVLSEIPAYETVTFQFTWNGANSEGLGMDWRGGDGLMFYVEHSNYDPELGTTTWVGEVSSPPLYYAGEHRWIYPECRLIDFGEAEQTVSDDFYAWIQQNAIPYNNLNNYVQIKGNWYFKENINLENFPTSQGSQIISFTTSVVSGSSSVLQQYNGFSATSDALEFRCDAFEYYYSDFVYQVVCVVGPWTGWREGNGSYRNISFGDEVQYVTKEFYNWFTKNAVPLTIEKGAWRFNKQLKPGHMGQADGSFKYGNTSVTTWLIETDEAGSAACLSYYSTTDNSIGIEEAYSDIYGWANDDYRTIEITEPLVCNHGTTALWFYENAHSMELKLYSECYIAETADKIRECTNDNTLTFKVSDLADGVQTAYDAGYSQGALDGGGDLPDLTNPATTGDVLMGKEYIDASGVKQTGTISSSPSANLNCSLMPNTQGQLLVSAGATAPAYIPFEGYTLGSKVVSLSSLDSDFKAENIKAGESLFGVTGTYEGEGGLTVDDVNISLVGAMPSGDLSIMTVDINGNTAWKTYAPANGKVLPENIVAGKTVLGIEGAGALASLSPVQAKVQLMNNSTVNNINININYIKPDGTVGFLLANPKTVAEMGTMYTFETILNAPIIISPGSGAEATGPIKFKVSAIDTNTTTALGYTNENRIQVLYFTNEIYMANFPMIYIENDWNSLEALGALMDWEIEGGQSSIPTITVQNYHPSYYLVFDLNSSDGCWAWDRCTVGPDDSDSFPMEAALADGDSIIISNVRWVSEV